MAYLTATALKNEGVWYWAAWQPVITTSGDFDTHLGTVVTRAAQHTEWRVGSTLYGTSDTLVQAILAEAELCLAQYYLLMASAGIADSSDDSTLQPFLQSGPKLLEDAYAYKRRYDEILAPYDQTLGRPDWARPGGTTTTGVPESIPDYAADVQFEAANQP
jgi:hypothetical protein